MEDGHRGTPDPDRPVLGTPRPEAAAEDPVIDAAGEALSGDASRPVVRGAAVRGLSYAVSSALIAGAFLFVFRDLGVVDFGRLSAAVALAGIAQSLGEAAISAVAQRLLVQAAPADRSRLAAQLIGLRLVIMPVAALCGVAFALLAGYPADQVAAVAIACLGAILAVVAGAYTAPLVIELRAARASVVELARQLAIAAGLVVAAWAGLTLAGYATVYVVAGVVAVFTALRLVSPQWRRAALPTRATLAVVAREASWLAVALTVNSLFLRLLTVVASVVTSDEETGLFATAARVVEVLAGLPLLMAAVAFPVLSRAATDGDRERLANAVDKVVRALVVAVGSVVVMTAVAARPLIEVFAGPEFADAAPVLQLQAFALLASTATQALIWVLVALHAERVLVVVNLVGLAVLTVTGAVALSLFGARGGALAAVVGEVVLVVLTLAGLHRTAPWALPRTGPLAAAVLLASAATVVGLILPVHPVIGALVGGALFAAAVLALRLVPVEVLRAVRPRA